MGNLIRIGNKRWPDPSTKKQRTKKPNHSGGDWTWDSEASLKRYRKRQRGGYRELIWVNRTLRALILLFFRVAIMVAMLYGLYDYGRRAM